MLLSSSSSSSSSVEVWTEQFKIVFCLFVLFQSLSIIMENHHYLCSMISSSLSIRFVSFDWFSFYSIYRNWWFIYYILKIVDKKKSITIIEMKETKKNQFNDFFFFTCAPPFHCLVYQFFLDRFFCTNFKNEWVRKKYLQDAGQKKLMIFNDDNDDDITYRCLASIYTYYIDILHPIYQTQMADFN